MGNDGYLRRMATRRMERHLLLGLVLVIARSLHAQQPCGTDELHQARLVSDPAYRVARELEEQALRSVMGEQAMLREDGDTAVHTIPVVVHVIHSGEPIGEGTNIPDAQVFAAIQRVNARFSSLIGQGPDIGIRFCLASRDPSGCSTNGITRADGSGVPGYLTEGIQLPPYTTCGAAEMAIKNLDRWPGSAYYNIWVVRGICSGVRGYAYLPNGGDSDGTVIDCYAMNAGSDLLAHELGHGFDLYHTFNGAGANDCPDDTDCAVNGDRVCDTPPHRSYDCGYENPCSATGAWDNSRFNTMSYCTLTDDLVRFTSGQRARMRASVQVWPRVDLLSSPGCTPVLLSIEAEPDVVCLGESSVLVASGTDLASYVWDTGELSASITVSPSGPSTHTVVATTIDGCEMSASVTLTLREEGTACSDGDPCTTGETWSACSCQGGVYQDGDSDGICDGLDDCPALTGEIGSACDDGDPLTFLDTMNTNCECGGVPLCEAFPPEAILSTPDVPLHTCIGAAITLDADSSTAATGTSITSFSWDIGDGTSTTTDVPTLEHAFTTSGLFLVRLMVTADNGCMHTDPVPLKVLVSSAPSFAGTTPGGTRCLGDSVTLMAHAVATPWNPAPVAYHAAGDTFSFAGGVLRVPLNVDAVNQGVVLNSNIQHLSVCAELEHGNMGGIFIDLECPDGQSVVLSQGGGGPSGTLLGDPVLHTCARYCWSSWATNGTWSQNSDPGNMLPAGTYTSVGELQQFSGCPTNGVWRLNVADYSQMAGGTLCDWSMEFGAPMMVDDSSPTPILGYTPDSCGWTGPDIAPVGADPLVVVATPHQPGTYDHVFHITDDLGCTHDTTITVFVPELSITALEGPDVVGSQAPVTFVATPLSMDAITFDWILSIDAGWDFDPSDTDHSDNEATLIPTGQAGAYSLCVFASNGACVGPMACMPFNSVVGTNGSDHQDRAVTVFPNPATVQLNVMMQPQAGLTVMDLIDPLGRFVARSATSSTVHVLDLSHLAGGTYILSWSNDRGAGRLPVFIER